MNLKKMAKKLFVNRNLTPMMLQCASQVNKDGIRRETINDIEHIVVTSYTLPDDIVMNGGLYPADEIENSFHTLERTLAPVEHPQDSNGNFLSAGDPLAINEFYAGAWNQNVTREDGRVKVEKWVNVAEAKKTERGRRLLDRINELETSEDPRPIHTSVGVFLLVEELKEVQTNAEGLEYTWIAREMAFDHDAILLDSVGAAQPHQGVGMAINRQGKQMRVSHATLIEAPKEKEAPPYQDSRTNAEGLGQSELYEQLNSEIREGFASEWAYVIDVFDDTVIFETNVGLFEVPYRVDDETATIVGIPVRVDRIVTYVPKTNHQPAGNDDMKEHIVNALKAAGIETDGLSDDALLLAYNKLQQGEPSGQAGTQSPEAIAEAVTNAMKPFADRLTAIENRDKVAAEAEVSELAQLVANSGAYAGLDEESAKLLPVEKLREMAANCGASYGVPSGMPIVNQQPAGYKPTELPD